MLRVWEQFEIESGYDQGRIEISTDDGATWRQVSGRSGQSGWRDHQVDLTSYAGEQVRLRFRLTTDGSATYDGWTIDEVQVVVDEPTGDSVSPLNASKAAGLSTTISSISPQNFPFVFMNVAVTESGAGLATLDASNFTVFEGGTAQTDFFEVTPPAEGGGVRLVDIVFLMDNSGSMSDEQSAVRNNVIDFVNGLTAEGVDFALGLTRFGASQNGGNPVLEDGGALTTDASYFKNTVWDRNVIDGFFEPGWDALHQAATGFTFRPGSRRVFILITDESVTGNGNRGTRSKAETQQTLLDGSVTNYALIDSSDATSRQDYGDIADATGGTYFNIFSPFDVILQDIAEDVSNTYVVRYRTTNDAADGTERQVKVEVSYDGSTATDTSTYTAGGAPVIARTDTTKALQEQAWAESTEFAIEAEVTDDVDPAVQGVRLFYKNTDTAVYTSADMTLQSGNVYQGVIPGSDVTTPGIDYYITATDGEVTASNPASNPADNPHQIAILPNERPAISHTPVTSATPGDPIPLSATVTDNTNALASVTLQYRRVGQLSYQEVAMTNTSGDTYEAEIPAADVTTDGVEYYLQATDDFGVASTVGSADAPTVVNVGGTLVVESSLASAPKLAWGESVDVEFTVTDQSGSPVEGSVLGVEDFLQSQSAQTAPTESDGKTTYTATAPTGVGEGAYELRVVATRNGYEDSEVFVGEVIVERPEETPNFFEALAYSISDLANIREEYEEENIKHLAYISLGLIGGGGDGGGGKGSGEKSEPEKFVSPGDLEAALYIDLDDMLGISREGQAGVVTFYIDVGVSGPTVGIPGLPSIGVTRVPFRDESVADPERDFSISAVDGQAGSFGISALSYSTEDGFSPVGVSTSTVEANASISLGKASWNFIRAEYDRPALRDLIEAAISPDVLDVNGALDGNAIIDALLETTSLFGLSPAPTLTSEFFRSFTSSDSGDPREVYASITYGRGGIDADGDGIPDNQTPALSYDVSSGWVFNLAFATQGTDIGDFLVQAEKVPEGWSVKTRDNPDKWFFKSSYNVANVPPQSLVRTNWAVLKEPSAEPTGEFEFVLYENNFGPVNTPLDTLFVEMEQYGEGMLAINGRSPVDLEIALPDGRTVSKDTFDGLTASYIRADIDGSGSPDTQVLLTQPPEGTYDIRVVPADTAKAGDTYTLEIVRGDSIFTKAENESVFDAPAEPYRFGLDETAPSPPSVLSASADGEGVTLSWQAPPENDLNQYYIYRGKPASFTESAQLIQKVSEEATEYRDSTVGQIYRYGIAAVDTSGNVSELSDTVEAFPYPDDVSADIVQTFEEAAISEDYRLVALPGTANQPVASLFEGQAGEDWRVFWDDGSASDYLIEHDGSSTFIFQAGRGFWAVSENDWTVDEQFETVALDEEYIARIPLRDGWNIISNPLDKNVAWSTVEAANKVQLEPLWRWAGRYETAETFTSAQDGEAFYFLNDQGLDVLQIPYPGASTVTSSNAEKAKEGPAPDEESSRVLALNAYYNDQPLTGVQIGVRSKAQVGLDPYDAFAPPAHFEAASLRLLAPSEADTLSARRQRLTRDFRSADREGLSFDLVLDTEPEEPVTLEATRLEDFAGSNVVLVERDVARTHDLHAQRRVQLRPEAATTHLTLLIGSSSYVEAEKAKLTPEVTKLLPNYPNPFNGRTHVSYALSEKKRVRLEIYDILGRRVRTLADQQMEPGLHRIEWDGRNEAGQPVASGVYLTRLVAGEKTLTDKMVLVR